MYCTNCGCKNEDNAEVCEVCGHALKKKNNINEKSFAKRAKAHKIKKTPSSAKKISPQAVIIAVSAIVLVAAIITVAIALASPKTRKPNDTVSSAKTESSSHYNLQTGDSDDSNEPLINEIFEGKTEAETAAETETEQENSITEATSLKKENGKKDTKTTKAATTKNTAQKVSNWVLASAVPSGAEIVSQKWTYDLTTKATSSKSSMNGYKLESTESKWSSYGSWSGWSTNSCSPSESRQVETRTTYRLCAFVCSKCGSHDPYSTPCDYGCNARMVWNEKWVTTKGNNMNKHTLSTVPDKYYVYVDGVRWWFEKDGYSDGQGGTGQPSRTEYRYRDRSKVKIYHFTKTESLESTTEITADSVTNSNQSISNIQKWVKYVAK